MKNLDELQAKKNEYLQQIADGIRNNDEEKMLQGFKGYEDMISAEIAARADETVSVLDSNILASRHVRQLTSAETKYYGKFIEAAKSASPVQAIANIDVAMPETVIDDVMTDLRTNHPLLSKINFVNTTALVKWIKNAQGAQQAVWGSLHGKIQGALSGSIKEINLTLCKLTAYMFVSKDLLELGPRWVDLYVRNILAEAVALSTVMAITDGTGKEEPIGMTRNVSSDVSVTGGVYPRKEAIAVTDLSPATYGTILSTLAVSEIGKDRAVEGVIMLVRPADYFKIVMPATTIQIPGGAYANNVLPFPTEVIQCVGVPEGHAIVGIGKNYFFGLGTGRNGRIERDDSYRFLDDEATYAIKMHGNGMPDDNNSFVLLDISNVQPSYLTVKTIDATPAAEGAEGAEG